jgi:FdhD protein
MIPSLMTVPIHTVEGVREAARQDLLAVEEPLEIRLDGRSVCITMRTPGHDFELAAGFLLSEGILRSADQIQPPGNPPFPIWQREQNVVTVHLKSRADVDFGRLERHFYVTSSCGVCGKASLEALQVRGCQALSGNGPVIDAGLIHRLPGVLRGAQSIFDRTGGLHAAALFDADGNLLSLREDVGRHNAVDKLIGAEFLAGSTPLSNHILLVSGRASFELLQKALAAGIPIFAAVGAPSSLAVEVARRFGITLIGFVRNERFNVYVGRGRIRETAA